ncbi:Class three stress gene repressor protein [Bhargavaea cecembensis DSE10]|uniref:Transcriptional regulator CtsR n=1 Tax=Bhargavaea cecembensis DSE10 TaxID=1235279 RepID=M7NCR6_9BACL|nr:CtsR family transcriptional regulator [Bhargavaea cecembensis]EMR06363.1 Class three stress gene repressor protein [Bhargavaea cecembensis DSE10]
MRNISDIIEGYLKAILEKEQDGMAEIKRSEVAEKFQCVPSQINYVIKTRFTTERGYMVESKRGGGGYIRIVRVRPHSRIDLIEQIVEGLDGGSTQAMAEDIIRRLIDEDVLTEREANMMHAAVHRLTLMSQLPERDLLRSRIMQAMLSTLKYEASGGPANRQGGSADEGKGK